MNIEFTSVKEMLTAIKSNLVAEKAKFNELQKEIDNDLNDCERALSALEKQEPELSKAYRRLPKKGDKVFGNDNDKYITMQFPYTVVANTDYDFCIINDKGNEHVVSYFDWENFFHFQGEQPTPEDLSNLHSFQHVNPEAKKKPYRIKTREEMIRDGANVYTDGGIYPIDSIFSFTNMMGYLHGRELDTNENQTIKTEPCHTLEYWTIDTWMITENK